MRYCLCLLPALVGTALGLTWSNTGDLAGARYCLGLTPGPNGSLYAAAIIDTSSRDSGAVFVSSDGTTWQPCGEIPGEQAGVYSILNTAGDTLFVGSSLYSGSAWVPRVYRSSDAGSSWTQLGTVPTPIAGDQVWALAELADGTLLAGVNWASFHSQALPVRSTDRGLTWTTGVNSGSYSPLSEYSLLAASDGTVYVGAWAGYRRLVYRSTDNGVHWVETDTMFDSGKATGIIEAGPGVLLACTYPRTSGQEYIGRIFKSTNRGDHWEEMGYGWLGSTMGIRSLLFTRDGRLFCGSNPSGEIYVSTDTGNTWTSDVFLPGATNVYALCEVRLGDSSYVYAATGPNGDVFRANLYQPTAVGAEPTASGEAFSVSPNPCLGLLDVRAESNHGQLGIIRLYSTTGRLVQESRLAAGSNPVRLSPALAPGIYYLRLPGGASRPIRLVR
jgi:hypothetical protein